MKANFVNDKALFGLTNNFGAMYINSLYKNEKDNILVVVPTLYEAEKFYNLISMYNENTLFFPMDDFITSEALVVSPEFENIRLQTLKFLLEKKGIVVTDLMGYLKFLPSRKSFLESVVNLSEGDNVNREKLVELFHKIGYKREINALKTGDFAIRGFVIDIFPIESDNGVRIEFFDDEIESIKEFDVDTQRTIRNIKKISIFPNNDDYNSDSNIYLFMENPIVIFKDYNQLINSNILLNEEIINYGKKNSMFDFDKIIPKKIMYLNSIDSDIDMKVSNKEYFTTKNIDSFRGDFSKIKNYLDNNNKTFLLIFRNKNILNKFREEIDIDFLLVKDINKISKNKINILIDNNITYGGEYNDLVILTERELFGKKEIINKNKKYFKRGKKIKDVSDIEKGDYIVHDIYGIGQYLGVSTLSKNGIKMDYIQIMYKNGDKLYIPAGNMNYISKYTGREGIGVKLNKLGSDEWEKTKKRIRNKVKDIAEKLIKINALREQSKGYAFSKDTEEQVLFESFFPYDETKDQLIAIKKIKNAMESETPMDMLLCGDVGYGKTEVAFRAMFKAVMDNKQVAYLCPTTLLSKQQYENALERFENFGVNIAILNRFVTKKQTESILNRLKEGKIDILIGTHRVLSKDIRFKDLGLLVIDEEQRFGVMHKERIKEIKANVDVLTLSATPIPRTMQMSLVGIKSLALIETAPVDRHAVHTYVIKENQNIIRDAIYKELGRNGQVFILYNKVDSIESKVKEIEKLAPDAKVTFAHGQMSKDQMENKINAFVDKEYDVLVCTTIIETGIDMPNVNTLIIYDADMFGLSQLYQIRGRVGRSERQAYAYLMYNGKKMLTESAVKRLEVIKDFTELGSGLSIAMRDLSIRGAGDILGSEQAGFIDSVGIDMYLRILNQEVNRLNGKEYSEEKEEKPLIDVETYISEDYTNDEEIKLEMHKLINEIDNIDKLNEVKKEIEDRFGIVTPQLDIYMHEELFEKMYRNMIDKVNTTNIYVEVILKKEISKNVDGQKLFVTASNLSKYITFSYKKERIHIKININKIDKHYIYLLLTLFEII